ncbi:hypothetical protein BV898_17832 [Hypsibius exemplaris]|uniref:Uncharacterized protein n=1 Tax=Hypsibius exemplaris TaxID=2072580 RepID=A0A9X6NIQ3_HYPEX|nr:hypothetical protein BV898_17832 [Hypsibius exemplaris]
MLPCATDGLNTHCRDGVSRVNSYGDDSRTPSNGPEHRPGCGGNGERPQPTSISAKGLRRDCPGIEERKDSTVTPTRTHLNVEAKLGFHIEGRGFQSPSPTARETEASTHSQNPPTPELTERNLSAFWSVVRLPDQEPGGGGVNNRRIHQVL